VRGCSPSLWVARLVVYPLRCTITSIDFPLRPVSSDTPFDMKSQKAILVFRNDPLVLIPDNISLIRLIRRKMVNIETAIFKTFQLTENSYLYERIRVGIYRTGIEMLKTRIQFLDFRSLVQIATLTF
jgi:hypothetical protein